MKNIKLSIVIPCYNHGEYLSYLLNSIKNKIDNDDIETIIINDGSTDSVTLKELIRIDNCYKSVSIINQENQGLAFARNKGINLAKGNYIIPLDADNGLKESFIDTVIEIFEESPNIDIIHGDAMFFGEREGVWKGKSFDWKEMVLNNFIDACAAFKKEVWEKLDGYDTHMPFMGFEDWDFWLRAANKGFKFHYLNEICFEYRARNGSMLSDAWKQREVLVEYIFNKKELLLAKELRSSEIELRRCQKEPSFKQILSWVKFKVNRKLRW